MAALTHARATAQSTTAPPANMVLEDLPLKVITPDPRNPRGTIDAASVEGLAASMASLGLLQPVRVARTTEGAFLLRAGHRRLEAARLLGWPTISAVIYETDEDDAIEAMLVENGQRLDLDPLAEARIVAELLSLPGMTRERAASRLGRSVSWVAKRSRLTHLSPAVRGAMQGAGVLASAPVSFLEEIALLPPHVQNALIGATEDAGKKKRGGGTSEEGVEGVFPIFGEWDSPKTLEDLRRAIRRACLPLRLAGWDLDDESLVPAVGACTACPRQTSADPDLFGSIDGAAADALCTDRRCWSAKQEAMLTPKLREAQRAHGKDLLVLQGRGGPSSRGESVPGCKIAGPIGLDVDWKRARKNSPGARPAFYASGAKVGTVEWVVPARAAAKPEGAPSKGVPISLEERRLRLERKRNAHVASSLLERNAHVPASTAFPTGEEAILALGAWGCDAIELWEWGAKTRLELLKGDHRAALERLWEGCQRRIEQALRRIETIPLQRQSEPEATAGELQAIAQVLKVDLDELRQAAVKDHPEPKSWAQEEAAAGEPAPAAKAPKKAAAKGAQIQ